MLSLLVQIHSLPFMLQSPLSTKFIGIIDNKPVMVDPDHSIKFDIRTNDAHESTLCTDRTCLHLDHFLYFSLAHSSKFQTILNEDGTITFKIYNNCLAENNNMVVLATCSTLNDRFIKIDAEYGFVNDRVDYQMGNDNIIFNYGVEDTNHIRDSIVQMQPEDVNYSVVPVERHHNAHVHKVGGFADKAFYSYYSYHPSSRHSMYNFHGRHHGVPKSWADEDIEESSEDE